MKRFFILFLATFMITTFSYAQGCSDAGFCTMGAMMPAQLYSKKINFKLKSIEFGQYIGKTTLSPKVFVTNVDFTFGINERTSFQVKLPFQATNGNLGGASGIGDISLSGTYNFHSTEKYHINGTLGMKIPSGDANKTDTNENGSGPLPMYYQVSLGSFDLVAGASLLSAKWLFATGIQIALTENNNQFVYEDWEDYPSQEYLLENEIATELKRGIDIMFRVQRMWHFSKFDFNLGLLPIIRVTEDEILDTEAQERVKLDGTTGMALSGLGGTAYNFSTTSAIKFIGGVKITQRKVNPDGLTRDWVGTLSYIKRF